MSGFRFQVWEAFGRSLREAREQRGMTQAELAKELERFGPGGSQSAIAKMERGERLVAIDHLAALVWILGVDVHTLLPEVVSADDLEGEAYALLAERDQLSAERIEWQARWDVVQRRLMSLETMPTTRTVVVPGRGEDDGQHPAKA